MFGLSFYFKHCIMIHLKKKNVLCICSLLQVKDEVNAGSLVYKLGKVEFKNVYFSYTNGSVHIGFYSLVRTKIVLFFFN